MTPRDLAGWIPIRLDWTSGAPRVDWCYLGSRRLTEPFFDQTIMAQLSHPAHALFRADTPIETLGSCSELRPGLPIKGFIFHVSRCGSTAVSQMLAAVSKHVVISEPFPLECVLHPFVRQRAVPDATRGLWVRWLLASLAQPREGSECAAFVKFDSWHSLQFSFLRQIFPNVPFIFVYRDPLEVLVSNLRDRGGRMLPGPAEMYELGLDYAHATELSAEEYGARVLTRYYEAALAAAPYGQLINYRQLPEIVFSLLPGYFNLDVNAAERAQMAEAAGYDAKNPERRFEDDSGAKKSTATESERRVVEQTLVPLYERLEAVRLGS